MVEEPHGSGASGSVAATGGMGLPFGVATLEGLGLRAYINKRGKAEWVWSRVHDYCKMLKEPGRFMMQSQAAWKEDLVKLQVPPEGLHFRGKDAPADDEEWKEHTVESRALCGILACLLKQRQVKSYNKVRALQLFMELAAKGFPLRDPQVPLMCSIQKPKGPMATSEVLFNAQQVTQMCLLSHQVVPDCGRS